MSVGRGTNLLVSKEVKTQSGHKDIRSGFMKVEEMNLREKVQLFFFILVLFFTLSSCASTSKEKKEFMSPEQIAREIESSKRVNAMNERLIMNTLSSRKASSRDYKIGPQDLLEITVFEVEKLNKTVRVTSQGNINLPLLGILRVKGLTAEELEKEIRSLLAEKYIQDPQVNVFIKEFRNQMISIMGAVMKPGVYDFTGQKTVLDLLAMAGGLRDDAGRLLFVIRPPNPEMSGKNEGSNDQKPTTFIVGLEELLIKGDPTMNLLLVHGDVVNVPTAGKVFVGGEVRNPGGYPLTRRMTVSQAITVAAGLTPKADGSETRIFRYSGKGDEKEVFKVNVYAIQKAQSEDPYVKENDIIIVPKSGTKTVLIEFWDILKGRIVGMPIIW
jgi:polysaccharide export outer membrane protein